MAPLLSGLCGALDRPHGGRMGAAAADQGRECRFDLRVSRMRIAIEELDRGHHPAVDAIGALVDLLFDPGLLNRVRLLRRAGAALAEPAAESRIDQAQLVAQGIQERHGGVIDLDRSRLAVDVEGELLRHGAFSSRDECPSSWNIARSKLTASTRRSSPRRIETACPSAPT